MKKELDQMFKDTGHQNAYFPLFVPKSLFEAEEKNATIGAGILDILPDQFGFLRPPGQKNSPNDIHVSRGIIRKY